MNEGFPNIAAHPYSEFIRGLLRKILPSDFFMKDKHLERYLEDFPILAHTEFREPPSALSFYLLCRYRPNAFKFFYEIITRWLVPGKRLDSLLFFAVDFQFSELSEEVYTVAEIILNIDNAKDLEILKRNLPIIETEIRLGVASVYHAQRILEIKGLAADEKTAMIQETIASLMEHRPEVFDNAIFAEMQHLLVLCSDAFKDAREYRHIARMIATHYLFRKALRKAVGEASKKRHLFVKLLQTRVHEGEDIKKVLGVVIGLNFVRDNEVFEEPHLLKAIQSFAPHTHVLEGSFVANISRKDPIRMLYLEVEKNDGKAFTAHEVKTIRNGLQSDLKNRVEHLMHPIFMPRNEEEIMRHIVTLASQLKYVRDLPQVIITFDEQTDDNVAFNVIMLRLLKDDTESIQDSFEEAETFLEFIPDRCRDVGKIRKRYTKEANVFRVQMDKTRFLREDHSLDLYKARQVVSNELTRLLGAFRDYNGGMISKQHELFSAFQALLGPRTRQRHHLLIENFFYALDPAVMRSVLEPQPLKTLFGMLTEALKKHWKPEEEYLLKTHREPDTFLAVFVTEDSALKDRVAQNIKDLESPSLELATVDLNTDDTYCLAYILRSDDTTLRKHFLHTLKAPTLIPA